MRYGYARVSSDSQDYSAQVEALRLAGCERVHAERASGKSTAGRPELAKLLKRLEPGDADRPVADDPEPHLAFPPSGDTQPLV
jgi:DNA invertase Pin-like site-specific DNA recombinase